MAPTSRQADRLFARRVVQTRDSVRRHAVISVMGVDRFMTALAARPVQRDEFGRFYLIGPSAFVEVRDRVLGTDGVPLRHWISVPPHMAEGQVGWVERCQELDRAS